MSRLIINENKLGVNKMRWKVKIIRFGSSVDVKLDPSATFAESLHFTIIWASLHTKRVT